MTLHPLHTYYWSQEMFLRNMGDLLIHPLLESLGYRAVHHQPSQNVAANRGRCFVGIGSVLVDWLVDKIRVPLDMWSVGWKGERVDRFRKLHGERVHIHAVRGPHTAAKFGLPADFPLGDSGLLWPHLVLQEAARQGRTILVPHYRSVYTSHSRVQLQGAGCDELLSTWVLHPQAIMSVRAGRWRQIVRTVARNAHRGLHIRSLRQTVSRIAGADFVLTGSLHGAILAQAYGVPWAAYDPGYIDFIVKWEDWAAYLGVKLEFARTIGEGLSWWQNHGRHGRIRSLQPLIRAFPYPIESPQVLERIAQIP